MYRSHPSMGKAGKCMGQDRTDKDWSSAARRKSLGAIAVRAQAAGQGTSHLGLQAWAPVRLLHEAHPTRT